MEEAKTDVPLALKNVMVKFAEDFSEYTRKISMNPKKVGFSATGKISDTVQKSII